MTQRNENTNTETVDHISHRDPSHRDEERWLLVLASTTGDTHFGASTDHNAKIVRESNPNSPVPIAYTSANQGAQIVEEHNARLGGRGDTKRERAA